MNPTLNLALSIDSDIRRADPTTIKNKFLVGYQGWFYCHGDGEPVGPGHHGWIHWFTYPVSHGGSLNIDYWPDTSHYPREELFVAPGFKHKDGSPAYLFSSRSPNTVQRHFHWMAENGVDGVFLQRFLGLCDIAGGGNDGNRRIRDQVGDHVQRAAEREGRVYAIMYDITGVQPERVQEIIEADWHHLLQEKRVLNSPNYLRENGKPVIAIWGFGFNDRNHTPAQVRALTSFFRNSTPGGAYLMAGTPAHWRTSDSDADRNPEFVSTWMESFDAISPWTVGRYSDQASADAFAEDRIQGDVMFIAKWAMTRGKRVDYVPVVHPGGSGSNVSNGQWVRNAAPRQGGRFLWRQIYNARKWGVQTMYGAMWDEYDEGTQFLPAITKTASLPQDEHHRFRLIAYDVDGYDVPPDWYMRIAGYASALVKGECPIDDRFPEQELRDWRPKYEVRPALPSLLASGSGSGDTSGQGQSYRDVLSTEVETGNPDEAPPPPYSLEAGEGSDVQPVASAGPETPISTRPNIPRQDSRLPPPIPPRPYFQPGRLPSLKLGPGIAPAIPLNSRPTTLPDTPSHPHPPALPNHRPLTAPSSPHRLSPNRAAPRQMQSSYPGQYTLDPQPPPRHQMHDSPGPSSFSPPTVPPLVPNVPPRPQPGSPWHPPPPGTHPAWSNQDWNYPNTMPMPMPPTPPAQFPTPGSQPPNSYDPPDGYGYPTMPHTPPISGPQRFSPGLPSPAPPPLPHHHPYSSRGRPEYLPQLPPPPPPPPLPHPPLVVSPHPSGGRKITETLIHSINSVSAAGGKALSKLTR